MGEREVRPELDELRRQLAASKRSLDECEARCERLKVGKAQADSELDEARRECARLRDAFQRRDENAPKRTPEEGGAAGTGTGTGARTGARTGAGANHGSVPWSTMTDAEDLRRQRSRSAVDAEAAPALGLEEPRVGPAKGRGGREVYKVLIAKSFSSRFKEPVSKFRC